MLMRVLWGADIDLAISAPVIFGGAKISAGVQQARARYLIDRESNAVRIYD
jgi:hypothetical protein